MFLIDYSSDWYFTKNATSGFEWNVRGNQIYQSYMIFKVSYPSVLRKYYPWYATGRRYWAKPCLSRSLEQAGLCLCMPRSLAGVTFIIETPNWDDFWIYTARGHVFIVVTLKVVFEWEELVEWQGLLRSKILKNTTG